MLGQPIGSYGNSQFPPPHSGVAMPIGTQEARDTGHMCTQPAHTPMLALLLPTN